MITEVTLSLATPGERVFIRNIYPLYLHDLSLYTEFYDLSEEGVWYPDYLPSFLDTQSPLVHPMLIRAGGRPAGFALIGESPFPHMTPGRDYRMCEFFVLGRYRRQGVGRRAAEAAFDRFRGVWEVSELVANTRAVGFWREVIGAYTSGSFAESIERGDVVQVFSTAR